MPKTKSTVRILRAETRHDRGAKSTIACVYDGPDGADLCGYIIGRFESYWTHSCTRRAHKWVRYDLVDMRDGGKSARVVRRFSGNARLSLAAARKFAREYFNKEDN